MHNHDVVDALQLTAICCSTTAMEGVSCTLMGRWLVRQLAGMKSNMNYLYQVVIDHLLYLYKEIR